LQPPDDKEQYHQSPRHWRPRFIGALIGDADYSSGRATFVSMRFLTSESWSKLTKILWPFCRAPKSSAQSGQI
jgi:hypothetical protein